MRASFTIKEVDIVLRIYYDNDTIEDRLKWILTDAIESYPEATKMIKDMRKGIIPNVKLSLSNIIQGLASTRTDNYSTLQVLKTLDYNQEQRSKKRKGHEIK